MFIPIIELIIVSLQSLGPIFHKAKDPGSVGNTLFHEGPLFTKLGPLAQTGRKALVWDYPGSSLF